MSWSEVAELEVEIRPVEGYIYSPRSSFSLKLKDGTSWRVCDGAEDETLATRALVMAAMNIDASSETRIEESVARRAATAGNTSSIQYPDAWDEVRRIRKAIFISVLLFPGGIGLIGALASIIPPLRGLFEVPIVPMAFMANLVVQFLRLQSFHCPRCHKTFYWTWLSRNPFSSRCLHCGLAEGT